MENRADDKLVNLLKYALDRRDDVISNGTVNDVIYWNGYVDGLKRALKELKGKNTINVEDKAGYRKQIEGEWIETDYKTVEYGFVERRGKAWLCTNCRHASKEFNPNMKYCPNCGAHMKGGAE